MLDIVMHNVHVFLLVNPALSACERRSCCSRLSDWLRTGSIQFDKSGRKRQWRRYANGKPPTKTPRWFSYFSSHLRVPLACSYVGEQNAHRPDNYNCSFPAMISDWRKKFYFGSDFETSPIFPFGFVQVQTSKVRETK